MDDELNLAQRHRFGRAPGDPTERDYRVLRAVILLLVLFWVGVILAVRACA